MKVAVVTAGSEDFLPLAAVTSPSKKRYAEKHGYDFYAFITPKEMGDACKYECYKQLADKGYDIYFWIDQDALIMNSEHTVEWLMQAYMIWDWGKDLLVRARPTWHKHFLWGYDHAGPNSGVYLAAYTPEARHFMDRAYATMLENGLADETAMEMTMLTPPFNEWVCVIPGVHLNAYDYTKYGWDKYGVEHGRKINLYEPGRFILHMPGYPNSVRIPELTKRAAEAT